MESLAKIRNTVCIICTYSKHVAGNKQNKWKEEFQKDDNCSAQITIKWEEIIVNDSQTFNFSSFPIDPTFVNKIAIRYLVRWNLNAMEILSPSSFQLQVQCSFHSSTDVAVTNISCILSFSHFVFNTTLKKSKPHVHAHKNHTKKKKKTKKIFHAVHFWLQLYSILQSELYKTTWFW